ncbi:MAG: DUF438 domain-containing protein [Acidobacteriota bacterium]
MSELIDNKAYRIRTLKEIIKHLHAGQAPEQVKQRLKELVRETDYAEIAAMEQELMAEGMPAEEVRSMCDLHSQVTREILAKPPERHIPPGHPIDTFKIENEALRKVVASMRAAVAGIGAMPEDARPEKELLPWRQALNDLMDVEKHYQRKELALFSCLERHGITGPSKVMWSKDDEVRGLLKSLAEALREEATAGEWKIVAQTVAEPAMQAVEEMIYKEERILFPLSLETLTEDEWAEIWSESPRFGWCLVEPREGYQPPRAVSAERVMQLPGGEAVMFPTGNLTFDQLLAVFSTLPVDLTFVDADDRVRYFSEGRDRIFSRSKAIIGRKVQHCHPPRSVSVVDKIVSDFRSGKQDVAEFWINFRGRFVHIRYFAMRDGKGQYAGTLEVTQDVTHIRALDGERRLLQYDEPEKTS